MGEYYGILQAISDILSIITITLCLVMKVPQILNLVKVKSVKGISINGLMLELSSYSVVASYNYCNGYALLSYMEYPIIIFQEIILIFLVLKYMDLLNVVSAGLFGLYLAIFGGFLSGILPAPILTLLVPLTTPVSASSKVVQLLAILRAKDSTSISAITWVISAFTNLTRIYTIYMDSADINLLCNFGVSVFLSSSILAATLYYKNPQTKEKAQ
ncbi:solute carrier family 66 member 3 [Ischnura elegans]|uniref:solute carrier family 66 member 3 n=1 Tax=Ischnura elegans TaxID=197161 RepID=UPI001ED89AF0|nr:solute carrier family 66 member 3 [Ischnura elegans]